MNYTQATISKVNQDVFCYYNNEKEAQRDARRMAKNPAYSSVWFGNEEKRTQVR